jgi:hypothetical protein
MTVALLSLKLTGPGRSDERFDLGNVFLATVDFEARTSL